MLRATIVCILVGLIWASGNQVAAADVKSPTCVETSNPGLYAVEKRTDMSRTLAQLKQIRHRTRVRQFAGISNVNISEWTTQRNTSAMQGALAFLKDLRGAYSHIDSGARVFIANPPPDWIYYGYFQDVARIFAAGNIRNVHDFVRDIYFWFDSHRDFFQRQGGIVAVFHGVDGADLVAYADYNTYKAGNVTSFLTRKTNLRKIKVSNCVFVVSRARRAFQELILEDKFGPIGIRRPYSLVEVK